MEWYEIVGLVAALITIVTLLFQAVRWVRRQRQPAVGSKFLVAGNNSKVTISKSNVGKKHTVLELADDATVDIDETKFK